MRLTMIAATALAVLPLSALAQSRPAPETPGETIVVEGPQLLPNHQRTNAVRVLIVTSGIIGGFIAADVISGGLLTAPLLRGGLATITEAMTAATPLRPVIAPLGGESALGRAVSLGLKNRGAAALR